MPGEFWMLSADAITARRILAAKAKAVEDRFPDLDSSAKEPLWATNTPERRKFLKLRVMPKIPGLGGLIFLRFDLLQHNEISATLATGWMFSTVPLAIPQERSTA
jgi:hypothetical protein